MSNGIINPKGRIDLNETTREITFGFPGENDLSLEKWNEKLDSRLPRKSRKKLVSFMSSFEIKEIIPESVSDEDILKKIRLIASLEHRTACELLFDGKKLNVVIKSIRTNFRKGRSRKELSTIVYESRRILEKLVLST